MHNPDSKARFSDRADSYDKYRPAYPSDAVDYIAKSAGLTNGSVVADIGSGTGIFTFQLLERGYTVYGVEPNAEMRAYAERDLPYFAGFTSVNGSAEATGLPDDSVDLITVAQAFHWFDRAACKTEFSRILRPGGHSALIWNTRAKTPGFMADYAAVLGRFFKGYDGGAPQERITDAELAAFFTGGYIKRSFPWFEPLGFDDLVGRALSNSHAPLREHPDHKPFIKALKTLFDGCSTVDMRYRCDVYIGRLA